MYVGECARAWAEQFIAESDVNQHPTTEYVINLVLTVSWATFHLLVYCHGHYVAPLAFFFLLFIIIFR